MAEWIVKAETIGDLVEGCYTIVKELIRCRDCKYYKKGSDDVSYCYKHDDDILWQDDDYCSRGERRTE